MFTMSVNTPWMFRVMWVSVHPGWVQLCFIGCGPFFDVPLAFGDDKFHVCLYGLEGAICTHSSTPLSLMKVDSVS